MRAARLTCRLLKGCALRSPEPLSSPSAIRTIAEDPVGCGSDVGQAAEEPEWILRHRLVDHLAACLHLAVEPCSECPRLLLVGAACDHEAPAPDDAVALGLEAVGQIDGRLVVARGDPDLPGCEALGDQLVVVVLRRRGAVPALLVGELDAQPPVVACHQRNAR